jgi:predicted ATP-grasp superfamily ATP-dependent carboligase
LTAAGTPRRSRLGLTPQDRPPAIVVGLDCITGLQTARLLATREVPVIGLAGDRRHFCARTRVPRAIIQARLTGEGLIADLERLGGDLPREAVLIPCTDAAVLAIATAADRLAGGPYRFVLPDADTVRRLMDKVSFAEHAIASGLPIPPTRILTSRAEAEAAAAELPMPAVLKPGLKTPAWQAATKAKAIRVESARELIETWDRASAWTTPLIAQGWIAGGEDQLISVNTYHDRDGNRQVAFVARKLRQWPVDTGTSSLGEEIRDDEARAIADRLFASVPYRGLGYVEMKRDASSGDYRIVEPNIGRPTGRSAIAERGGVELVLTAYRDALGESLPEAREQRYRGVKWIYWRHDLQSAIVHARRGEVTPGGWLQSVRGRRIEAVGSIRDPLPFVADLAGAARAAIRAAGRTLVRSVRRRATSTP